MSLYEWIIGYAIQATFWIWVTLLGGDRRLEGSFLSGFVIDYLAPRWSADGIRLFAWLCWAGSTFVFIAGILDEDWRVLGFL